MQQKTRCTNYYAVQWLWSFVTGSCRHWCTRLPKRIHMSLTIASLNVRGLRDNTKRREMFTWLCAKHFSIYMLQEVHCTDNTNSVWSAEWGYQAIFSNYKSNKAGVCILFNNNFKLQIEKVFIDTQGRFIICDIRTNETSLTLANIYAPNADNPAIFLDLFDHLADLKGDYFRRRL